MTQKKPKTKLWMVVILAVVITAMYVWQSQAPKGEAEVPAVNGTAPVLTQQEASLVLTQHVEPRAAEPTATPRLNLQQAPEGSARYRVVLISIDAARAMDVWPMALNGTLRNLGEIARRGIYGEITPVYPAETSPNHAAIITGAPTGVHGVVGNRVFYKSPFEGGSSEPGYWGRALVADTIWQAAERKGLRVTISNFIHGYVPTWQGMLNNTVIVYATKAYRTGLPFTDARVIENVRTQPATGGLYQFTFSIADSNFTALVRVEGGVRILYVYNGTQMLFNVREGEWLPVDLTVVHRGTKYRVTFMIKPLDLRPNATRVFIGNMLVYNSPVPWFMGPESLKERYWSEVASRGYIDIYFMGGGVLSRLDLRTIAEIVNATVDWYWRTNLFLFENTNFDLFTGYDVTPDVVEHAILGLFDPSKPYSNATLAQWARRTYLGMWQRIDSHLGRLMSKLRPSDVLIVVGDHGQWGINAYVRINVALRKAGLLHLDSGGRVDFSKSLAYYEGPYIYINPKIRQDPALYRQVVNKVIEVVTSITDPRTGEKPIAIAVATYADGARPLRDLTGVDTSLLYLEGRGARGRIGDVAIAVKPGYCAYDRTATGEQEIYVPSIFETVGCHDGAGTWAEVRSIIGIYGGEAVRLRQMKGISAWMPQVGATVAAILGLDLRNATATPIWIFQN